MNRTFVIIGFSCGVGYAAIEQIQEKTPDFDIIVVESEQVSALDEIPEPLLVHNFGLIEKEREIREKPPVLVPYMVLTPRTGNYNMVIANSGFI